VAGHIKLKNVYGSRFSVSHKISSVKEYEKQLIVSKNRSFKANIKIPLFVRKQF